MRENLKVEIFFSFVFWGKNRRVKRDKYKRVVTKRGTQRESYKGK